MRTSAKEKKPDWVKVDPCLYPYRGATYYVLFKVGGRQIRSSLETQDLELVQRRVRKLRRDMEVAKATRPKVTLEKMADCFLATLRGKPSSVFHKGNSIRMMLKD